MGLRVNKCCCMSLRTGGLVIGCIGLVLTILYLLVPAIIVMIDHYSNDLDGRNISEIYSTTIPFFLINVAINGYMIYGIRKNKHKILLAWLIWNGIGAVLVIPLDLLRLGYSVITANRDQLLVTIFDFFCYLFIYGCLCFMWLVIYSLYKEIRESTQQQHLPIDGNRAVGTARAPPYLEFESKAYDLAHPKFIA